MALSHLSLEGRQRARRKREEKKWRGKPWKLGPHQEGRGGEVALGEGEGEGRVPLYLRLGASGFWAVAES